VAVDKETLAQRVAMVVIQIYHQQILAQFIQVEQASTLWVAVVQVF
jgi:hypothetical protein